jgi:hypothetical protein
MNLHSSTDTAPPLHPPSSFTLLLQLLPCTSSLPPSCYFWDPSVHNFTGKPKSTVLLVDKESGVR